jgi:predicted ester cyclase
MSHDTIEALARRFVTEHNSAGFRRALDELLGPDAVFHEYLPGVPDRMDRRAFEAFIGAFRAALPDIRNEVNDVVADGQRASVRWTGHGTHTGEALMQMAARGGRVTAHGIYILHFQDERIVGVWNHWDNLNVIEQLKGS